MQIFRAVCSLFKTFASNVHISSTSAQRSQYNARVGPANSSSSPTASVKHRSVAHLNGRATAVVNGCNHLSFKAPPQLSTR
jgi:hypothetical protein